MSSQKLSEFAKIAHALGQEASEYPEVDPNDIIGECRQEDTQLRVVSGSGNTPELFREVVEDVVNKFNSDSGNSYTVDFVTVDSDQIAIIA